MSRPDPFRVCRRIEFRDTDAGGIVHFSVYFTLMEEAEHAFWRSLGRSVVIAGGDEAVSWPRVSANCDFNAPLRFEDEVEIEVAVRRRGAKSVTFAFDMKRGETDVAAGELIAVCCRIRHGKPPEAIPIPDDLATELDRFLIVESPS